MFIYLFSCPGPKAPLPTIGEKPKSPRSAVNREYRVDVSFVPSEIGAKRLRIINDALSLLDDMGGCTREERLRLVGAFNHSTPVTSSLASEFQFC